MVTARIVGRTPLSSALTASRRARELEALADEREIDLLVIGGGITGVGIALDAASRGLRTVLVERHDLAHGTSRFSSKLVHGGLRYLASGQVGIAREVVPFDQDGAQAAARGIQCDPHPGDAAADDEQIDLALVGERLELSGAPG